jgi:hypothetical protein
MLTRAEAETRDRIQDTTNLERILRQFGAETDIQTCCLSPSEVRAYTANLMALRQRIQAIHYRDCILPAGMFRPRAGERKITEYHRHEWR